MKTKDVRQLVQEIVTGNRGAFEEIIRNHERLVSHIVFRMVTNSCDQEDVCQEIFIKVFHHLPSFHFESKMSTWIGRIAYNTCINYLKKKKVPLFEDCVGPNQSMDNYLQETVWPDELAEGSDLDTRLQEEIKKLPTQYRTILTLYHLDEMSYSEIAEITQLPDGTVKSYLFRARKQLKERLSAKYQPEELCL